MGEVVVYNVRGKDIPIVHRVIRRFGGGYAILNRSGLVADVLTWLWQECTTQSADQGRQQCSRRHGALRARPELPRSFKGRYW